jgi:hypothetical protein
VIEIGRVDSELEGAVISNVLRSGDIIRLDSRRANAGEGRQQRGGKKGGFH